MELPVPELAARARACASALNAAESVLLASHVDADGLTSAAIGSAALSRAKIPHEVIFEKQLDADGIVQISRSDHETVLFTDFGSGQLADIAAQEASGAFTPVVVDHHQPANAEVAYHCNPLLEGVDGTRALSGAGATYLVARALAEMGDGPADTVPVASPGTRDNSVYKGSAQPDPQNRDLAGLAVVGAVGDMQLVDGELVGANAAIGEEGEAAGVLETTTDLAIYGTQTRELPKLLAFASDVHIPGITGNRSGAVSFLDSLSIPLRDGDSWRRWIDLEADERQTVVSALIQQAIQRGVSSSELDGLVGTRYTLAREAVGTELRDASEFSTLLNATARYEESDVGLAVCLGNRDGAYERARELLRNHRHNLSQGIEWVEQNGVQTESNCQWFHAGTDIRATIVGIVAGMAYGVDNVDRSRVIVAFATKRDEPETTKVSARATTTLTRNGVDLSAVMGQAAGAVGGEGGGHTIAAGASIPEGQEEQFIEAADGVLESQLAE